MKKWKRLRIVSVVLIMSMMLSACGSGESANPSTNTANGASDSSASSEKQKVDFWYYFGGNEEQVLLKQIEKFNNSQDKYEVVSQYIPFADIKQRLSVGMMGDELPDIVTIDNPDHASFASAGLLADITSRVQEWGEASNYMEGPLNSSYYDGKIYGLPMTTNTLAIFYNKDMFAQAGIEEFPTTWDEFREVAKKLTTANTYGLGFAGQKSEEGAFDFMPWLLSTGANYDSLNTEEGLRAFNYITDLLKDGSVSKEVLNLTNGDTQKQFSSGQLAMMVNGSWNIAAVKADSPDLNFGIATFPIDKQAASSLGGDNIAIINNGNVDGAWEFLKWFSSAEQLGPFLEETGYLPVRTDIDTSYWEEDEYLKPFLEQLKSAQPRGPHPKWPEISLAIQEAYQKSFSLSYKVEDAVAEAAQKIDKILSQN